MQTTLWGDEWSSISCLKFIYNHVFFTASQEINEISGKLLEAHSFLSSSRSLLTADVTFFLQNVFYILLLLVFYHKIWCYTITVFKDSQKFERNQIVNEAFNDEIDFDGNFIEDILNKVMNVFYVNFN